jgi:transcriptional regulator with XRE-family HTH domain
MARKDDTYEAGRWERAAVENYRNLIGELYRAQAKRDMTLRALADKAGVAVSGVNALVTGSAWPRLNTLAAVAGAVGLELHIDGDPDVRRHLLANVRGERDLSLRDVAGDAGLRPNTVSELKDQARSPSMKTVLMVAAVRSLKLELRSVLPAA